MDAQPPFVAYTPGFTPRAGGWVLRQAFLASLSKTLNRPVYSRCVEDSTMIRQPQVLICVLLVFLAPFAWVDSGEPTPAKPGKIAREPVYKQATQQYLLLLLGQNPPRDIWIVRDGSDVYVDRNGNGDLTEAGEKVVQPDTQESSSYVKLGTIQDAHGQEHGPLECRIPTRGGGSSGLVRLTIAKKFAQEANFIPLATTPDSACVLHFDGPLTSSFLGAKDSRRVPTQDPKFLTLSRSKARLLGAWVGTQLKDSPAVCCVTFSVTGEDKEKQPQVKIVYENRDPKGPPVVESHLLEEETRTIFSDRLKAPANSGGKAKLILTFSAPRNIPPYEIEVNVVD